MEIIPVKKPEKSPSTGDPTPGIMQAVFDSISEQIAVLDASGRIMTTNKAWNHHFGRSGAALQGDNANYLDRCQHSRAHNPGEMRTLTAGIRSVLNGTSPSFRLEYRRQNPEGGHHQFAVLATPLPGGGAVVVHEDVTERRLLEREIITISEYERQQIGQELHDGLCQVLGGMMLSTAVIASSLRQKNLAEAEEISRLVQIAREATNQARELSRSLHPVELDGRGLEVALDDLASSVPPPSCCSYYCPSAFVLNDSQAALFLYRIAQEAVHYAWRNTQAKNIRVGLSQIDHSLVLRVEEDGRKCVDPADQTPLRIMQYRAKAMGARLQIRHRRGQGSQVTCVLPLPSPETSVIKYSPAAGKAPEEPG